jgi:hypothetical protein
MRTKGLFVKTLLSALSARLFRRLCGPQGWRWVRLIGTRSRARRLTPGARPNGPSDGRNRPFAALQDRLYERAGSARKRSSAESVGRTEPVVAARGGTKGVETNSERSLRDRRIAGWRLIKRAGSSSVSPCGDWHWPDPRPNRSQLVSLPKPLVINSGASAGSPPRPVMIAPRAISCWLYSSHMRIKPLLMSPIISAPTIAPGNVPTPPTAYIRNQAQENQRLEQLNLRR